MGGEQCSHPGEFSEGAASDKSPIAASLGENFIFNYLKKIFFLVSVS